MPVLVGCLDTPEGRAAVERAAQEAILRRTALLLLAYVPLPIEGGTSMRYGDDRLAMERRIEAMALTLREGGCEVSVRVVTGSSSPSEAILQTAHEEQAELIVIGLRRRSRVGKALVGSTAQDVLLGAVVPVLGVRPPAP